MPIRDERLREALRKPSPYGPDLDISSYSQNSGKLRAGVRSLGSLGREFSSVGIEADEGGRAGTYLQADHSAIYKSVQKVYEDSLEIMSIEEAMKEHDWVAEYSWKLVDPWADKYTAFTAMKGKGGYFIRVFGGKEVSLPIQSCLYLRTTNLLQAVHNIIIMERDSTAQLITGCLTHPRTGRALHIGVSEFYLKRGARLTFTMVHNWGPKVDVRPRTGILLEDGGTYVSNYVCLGLVNSLQMYPKAEIVGNRSTAAMNSIIYGKGHSYFDVGGQVVVRGNSNVAEIIGRTVTTGSSRAVMRARLMSGGEGNKGHIECRGLMLSPQSEITAVPELVSKSSTSELTHEAAIGRLNEEQVLYLMSRGLKREDAESLLIKGFLDVSMMKLPGYLQDQIEKIIHLAMTSGL